MESARAIASRLEAHLPALREQYGLGRVCIYGSFARGEATPRSDVDLLIEFTRVPSLFDIARLQAELERLLGRRVDIATPGGMHPRVLAAAQAEAISVGA